eukprot:g10244.t1
MKSKGTDKGKGGASKGGREDARTPTAGGQQRKTLAHGVDTAAFLECDWLSRDASAAAAPDTCVAPFAPDAALQEAATVVVLIGLATVEAWPRLGGALLSFLATTLDQMEVVAEEFVSVSGAGVGAGAAGKSGSAGARVGAGGKGTATAAGSAAGGNARGGGGAGSLPLLWECFAELFRVEKPSAYQHAYAYVHYLAREALAAAAQVHKRGRKTREPSPVLRRLRSWEFLQSLQLWASVVAAHPAKSSLGPLMPPLAKVLEITFQMSPGVYAPPAPWLSHGARNLAASLGVFLPTSHHFVTLLDCWSSCTLERARAGRTSGTRNRPMFPAVAAASSAGAAREGDKRRRQRGRG